MNAMLIRKYFFSVLFIVIFLGLIWKTNLARGESGNVDVLFYFNAEFPKEISVNEQIEVRGKIRFVRPQKLQNVSVRIIPPRDVDLVGGDSSYAGILEENEIIELLTSFRFSSVGNYKIHYVIKGESPWGNIAESKYITVRVVD